MSKGKYTIKNISELQNIYDIEISIPIIIDNVKTKYFITSYGRVYRIYKDTVIKYIMPNIDDGGYLRHDFHFKDNNGNKKRVSIMLERLVAMAFISNPKNLNEVNHIDGNKKNNCVWNLEWCSHSENMIHAYDHNLNHSGEDNSQAIYKESQIRNVCLLLEENEMTLPEISNCTGVSPYMIYNIRRGIKWKRISSQYNIAKYNVKTPNHGSTKKYNINQIEKVCKLLEEKKYTLQQISTLTSVNFNTVADIKRHRSWTNISKKYIF